MGSWDAWASIFIAFPVQNDSEIALINQGLMLSIGSRSRIMYQASSITCHAPLQHHRHLAGLNDLVALIQQLGGLDNDATARVVRGAHIGDADDRVDGVAKLDRAAELPAQA